eukprot:m.18997 g.18997  ORF g.18997 m.18997 type:complete len:652 (+) comp7968_c0_seq1:189-2144(+)
MDTQKDSVAAGAAGSEDTITDPFFYLKRQDGTTSAENNKVLLSNMGKYVDAGSIKRLLKKHDLDFVRVKKSPQWKHALITFKNEEDRRAAIDILNGLTFKGRALSAKESKPSADPFVKRTAEMREQRAGAPVNKRAKQEAQTPAVDLQTDVPPLEQVATQTCPLWKDTYERQLVKKRRKVVDVFQKMIPKFHKAKCEAQWLTDRLAIAGVPCPILDTVPSPIVDGYRTKCEFSIGTGPEREVNMVGFRVGAYMDGSITVVPPTLCPNVSDTTKAIVTEIQTFLKDSPWSHYNKLTHEGHWRQLLVRETSLGERMAVLFVQARDADAVTLRAETERLREFLSATKLKALGINAAALQVDNSVACSDPARPDPILVAGKELIVNEKLLGCDFRISPDAFFQVNIPAAEKLFTLAREWCKLEGKGNELLLDICCGTGTIGLTMAKHVKSVIGVEMCVPAVEDAKLNAVRNGVTNATYFAGKAEDVMPDLLTGLDGEEEVVGIVDPPRAGLHQSVIHAIRRCTKLERLVYVSCSLKGASQNIVDLCRPTSKRYRGEPFQLIKAVPVDMFPHTDHCEVLLYLSRSPDVAKEHQEAFAEEPEKYRHRRAQQQQEQEGGDSDAEGDDDGKQKESETETTVASSAQASPASAGWSCTVS